MTFTVWYLPVVFIVGFYSGMFFVTCGQFITQAWLNKQGHF